MVAVDMHVVRQQLGIVGNVGRYKLCGMERMTSVGGETARAQYTL